MKTRGMQLYINRNTKTAKGFFVLKEIGENNNRVNKDKEEKYEVKMVGNKIIPTEQINDEKIKKKLKTSSFLCNMESLKISKNTKMVSFHIILKHQSIRLNINYTTMITM